MGIVPKAVPRRRIRRTGSGPRAKIVCCVDLAQASGAVILTALSSVAPIAVADKFASKPIVGLQFEPEKQPLTFE